MWIPVYLTGMAKRIETTFGVLHVPEDKYPIVKPKKASKKTSKTRN